MTQDVSRKFSYEIFTNVACMVKYPSHYRFYLKGLF
ncbi:MAG: hypothetical protein ACD_79C00260G0001, partial [uncultured bacterium]